MQGGSTGAELLSIDHIFLKQGWDFITLPQAEQCLVNIFVPTQNCQDLKLPLWSASVNPLSPPAHQDSAVPHQGTVVCSRSILLPTLPLSHPSDKLSQHYLSSQQQKVFLLVNVSIISPSLRLLPLRSLKSSWSLQADRVFRLTVFSSHLWHCHFLVFLNPPSPPFLIGTTRTFWNERIHDRICWSWISSQGNGEVRREMERVQLRAAVMRQSGLIFI